MTSPPSHTRAAGLHRALLVLVPALAACGSGSSGSSTVPQTPGSALTVGALEVETPTDDEFLLHGTLPIPRGTWTDIDGQQPFAVLDVDGTPLPTQTEVVSRYPSAHDGADVVEVIARVHRGEALAPGARKSYVITLSPTPRTPVPLASVEALWTGPAQLPAQVLALLQDPESLVIEVIDVFGNAYTASPLDGTGELKLLRHGEVQTQLRVATTLAPKNPTIGAFGTLPHHLGLHLYLTTTCDGDVVGADLRLHNGHSGKDKSSALDDALGRVFFREINLNVPSDWQVIQDYDDPFLGPPTSHGSRRTFPLVAANPDGTMHVMDWQAQFHRRLALAPDAAAARARELLRGAGLGFARRGNTAPDLDMWSWWNADTARWFPQSQRLPSLAHAGLDLMQADLQADLADVQTHLEQGTSGGGYPVACGVLGWSHPFGVGYGGMSGGAEIFMCDGLATLEAASLDGYRLTRIVHRMQTDRMPCALYDLDGEPSALEDWVVEVDGVQDYVPFFHYLVPSLGGIDPFGVTTAPTFQLEYVEDEGLEPGYMGLLGTYFPHDYQHFIRYTRSAKVLAWLANDSMAKDDLAMQAANFRMSYHRWYNSPYQHVQNTGLRFDRDYVDEHPGAGFTFGRGEGWAIDCVVAAYATGSPAWRAQQRPWIDRIVSLVAEGQGDCNGFVQATVSSKLLDGDYHARQIIEQSILENALYGLIEGVYRGDNSARTSQLEAVLTDSLWSMLSEMAWDPDQPAPWAVTAVAPLDELLPIWCDASEIPADGFSTWTDSFQNWSSFAYGFQLTGDPTFLLHAQLQHGSPDLLGGLMDDGLENIENRAALLAIAQELAGVF